MKMEYRTVVATVHFVVAVPEKAAFGPNHDESNAQKIAENAVISALYSCQVDPNVTNIPKGVTIVHACESAIKAY